MQFDPLKCPISSTRIISSNVPNRFSPADFFQPFKGIDIKHKKVESDFASQRQISSHAKSTVKAKLATLNSSCFNSVTSIKDFVSG